MSSSASKDEVLILTVEARDEDLDGLEDVVGNHLVRFAAIRSPS